MRLIGRRLKLLMEKRMLAQTNTLTEKDKSTKNNMKWLLLCCACLFLIYAIIDFFYINKMSETGYFLLVITIFNTIIQFIKKDNIQTQELVIKNKTHRYLLYTMGLIILIGGIVAAFLV